MVEETKYKPVLRYYAKRLTEDGLFKDIGCDYLSNINFNPYGYATVEELMVDAVKYEYEVYVLTKVELQRIED